MRNITLDLPMALLDRSSSTVTFLTNVYDNIEKSSRMSQSGRLSKNFLTCKNNILRNFLNQIFLENITISLFPNQKVIFKKKREMIND